MKRGLLAVEYGDYDRALQEFKAAAYVEESADALTHWGWMEHSLGNTERAIELCKEAIDVDPAYPRAYVGIAYSYLTDWGFLWNEWSDEILDRAVEFARKAVALDDSESRSHWVLAYVLTFQRKYEEADAHQRKAVALNPNDPDILAKMGYVVSLLGKCENAVELAEKATRLNPHHPVWYNTFLGFAYYMWGVYSFFSSYFGSEIQVMLASREGPFILWISFGTAITTAMLLFAAACSQIAFEAENRTTWIRIMMMVQQTFFIGICVTLLVCWGAPSEAYWIMLMVADVSDAVSNPIRMSIRQVSPPATRSTRPLPFSTVYPSTPEVDGNAMPSPS